MVPEPLLNMAHVAAEHVYAAYLSYNDAFSVITRRAKQQFENRDWAAHRVDTVERLHLYDWSVGKTVEQMEQLLGNELHDRCLWKRAKELFVPLAESCPDVEFTRTYFSSVTRRIFQTVGIDPEIEFTGEETAPLRHVRRPLDCRNYSAETSLRDMFFGLLQDYEWATGYVDQNASAHWIADQVSEHYQNHQDGDSVLCVDVMETVFYRDTRAYVIGKITGWTRSTPLVIALKSTDQGIEVDAVIQTDGGVGNLFGFARSYFHADLANVGEAIVFLRRLMPRRPINELFTVLGRAKQGKTERFRDFASHLAHSHDRFIYAPGTRGMVMLVFTLPSYDVVFKVIRDEFAPPKRTTRDQVRERYEFVFKHDKAGRLMDTQEFQLLALDRDRFSPDLLEELLSETSKSVRLEGDRVILEHVYVERRLRPLNLYLEEVSQESAEAAACEYGAALRDLAAANIFAGDLLVKNFGVSYHGRVIFYDYDEICLLTECNFRAMPKARTLEEELSAEPWYFVAENDVFPEEFGAFLGLTAELREAFLSAHADLLEPEFWQRTQDRIRSGEVLEVLPY